MVATVVLNSTNLVLDGKNNKLVYNFPNSLSFPHHEISIQSINMYYSWENVNSTSLLNNTYWISWPSSSGSLIRQITIPNGLYEVADLNTYLQYYCILQGWYLYNLSGLNMYFAEFVINPSTYSVQINTFVVPTTLPSGYLAPTNWTFPSFAGSLPVISMDNPVIGTQASRFNELIGYSKTFTTDATIQVAGYTSNSYQSSVAPQIQPNPVLYVSASNIENKYASPSSIIGTVSPSVAFGDMINEVPPQFAWNKLLPGTYNGIRVSLLGADIGQIKILDPNITIVLVIRDKNDSGISDALKAIK